MTIEEFIERNQQWWNLSMAAHMCISGGYSKHHKVIHKELLNDLNNFERLLKIPNELSESDIDALRDLRTLFSNNNSWSQPE